MIFSTSVYNTVQIKLISRETNTFCNNCNDYALCMVIKADKAVNFGDGEGIQVPCKLRLSGQEKFVNILKKELERLEKWALCNCTQQLKNSQAKKKSRTYSMYLYRHSNGYMFTAL